MSESEHGGQRKGAGRPHAEDPRAKRIALRLTEAEYATVVAAAALDDTTPSDWVRDLAVLAAERKINRPR